MSLYVSEYLSCGAARVCRSVFTLTPQPISVPALFASKPLGSEGAIFHAHWFSVAAKRTLTGRSLKREVQAFSPKYQSHVYSAGWMKDRAKKKMRGVEKNSKPDGQDENNFFACLRVWFMIMLLQNVLVHSVSLARWIIPLCCPPDIVAYVRVLPALHRYGVLPQRHKVNTTLPHQPLVLLLILDSDS